MALDAVDIMTAQAEEMMATVEMYESLYGQRPWHDFEAQANRLTETAGTLLALFEYIMADLNETPSTTFELSQKDTEAEQIAAGEGAETISDEVEKTSTRHHKLCDAMLRITVERERPR